MPSKNPYRPGASVTPLFIAGREGQERRFRSVLRSAPEIPANVRVTGLRGVGKSVLLKRFEDIAAQESGWAVQRVQLEPRHNREEALVDLLVALARRTTERLSRAERAKAAVADFVVAGRSLLQVTGQDITFSIGGDVVGQRLALVDALLEVTQSAVQHGRAGYVMLLDEAQVLVDDKARIGEHPLSLLIASINALQEAGVPIGLILCGLPTLKANMLKARTYSERMFRGEDVDSLSASDAAEAFVKPLDGTGITATAQVVADTIAAVDGYPFFIQLWGAELWDAAEIAGITRFDSALLDAIRQEILDRLDRDFYDSRIESLTPAEQDLLLVTGRCEYPPLRTADIHQVAGRSEGNVNVLMGRLAEQGVVYRVQKGQYRYTAPQFHEYLRRREARPSWRR